jgi:hypothetical protein
VAEYDTTRPLIIDPVVSYATYLGGSDGDSGADIAVDSTGAAYVTGVTRSLDFPTRSPLQSTLNPGGDEAVDAFVAKLSPDGSSLAYATYLGGNGFDQGLGIALDPAGNVYVAGFTQSTDFLTTPGAFQRDSGRVAFNGFVAKFNSTGSALVYSTYLGGGFTDAKDIAVDGEGNVYVTGSTGPGITTTPGSVQPAFGGGTGDGYIAKLNPTGSALVYSTYLGGDSFDIGVGIAVDAAGNAYVTGATGSSDFPITAGAVQPIFGGDFPDAFITKLNPSGSAIVYSSYLGGSNDDGASSVAVDISGNAYVTGATHSADFPTTTGALQPTFGDGTRKAFVTKLDPAGSGLVYSTFLGGTGIDEGLSVAVDTFGNAYLAGEALSFDFPTTSGPLRPRPGGSGSDDGNFVAKFAADGALVYSVPVGGGTHGLPSIAVDAAGAAYVTGDQVFLTLNFATTNAFQREPGGAGDAYVLKLTDASTDVPLRNVNSFVELPEDALSTTFDPTPVPDADAGGTFRIIAGFDNVSTFRICNPFFNVVELSDPSNAALLQGVWVETDGQQIQGPGSHPVSHPTLTFEPGSRMRFRFDIALPTTDPFRFFVNVWGTPQAPGAPCP